jgi:hypothetical protein
MLTWRGRGDGEGTTLKNPCWGGSPRIRRCAHGHLCAAAKHLRRRIRLCQPSSLSKAPRRPQWARCSEPRSRRARTKRVAACFTTRLQDHTARTLGKEALRFHPPIWKKSCTKRGGGLFLSDERTTTRMVRIQIYFCSCKFVPTGVLSLGHCLRFDPAPTLFIAQDLRAALLWSC